MTDIAPIKGLIELQDEFTSRLGLAEAALDNFSKKNQESLKAVAGAAGLITAAVTAVTVAVIELGKRGSEVNDVKDTLEHFAGGAKLAADDMNALRLGVKNTVDDFMLAKDAAHLLSAGVKLTAQDFGTLGDAAFVMKNRGLGPAKDNLQLISEAMITGRTRALSMALGVIDVGDAEANFAKKIGLTKDELNESGKAEAKRVAVMEILKNAVKDAGEQERNFGDEFTAAGAKLQNWLDDLGSAIAKSEVFKAGFKAVEEAVASAFSNDKGESIKVVTGLIEKGAIAAIGFGQAMIPMAKIVEGAWNLIRTVVLGVEGVVVEVVREVVVGVEKVAEIGAKLHIVSPDQLQEVKDLRIGLEGMVTSFQDQTAAAAQAIVGHTKFDDTLDRMSASLGEVKASMLVASTTTKELGKDQEDTGKKAGDAAKSQKSLTDQYGEQDVIAKKLAKSTAELAQIYSDYAKQVAKDSGTTKDAQIADIEATFKAQVAALEKMDPLFKEKYAAYRAIADEALKSIGMEWDSVRDQSLEALQQQRDAAEATYNAMLNSSLTFSRDVLDAQRQKWMDLRDAVRDYGTAGVAAVGEIVNEMHELIKASDAAYEAEKKLKGGFSYDVTSQNFNAQARQFGLDPGQAYELAKKGYSFAEIIQIANNYKNGYNGPLPPPSGPKIPGFAEGGMVMVGEKGPEAVRLPFGSTVYPSSMSGGMGVTVHMMSGAVVFNYPIMNDPRSKAEMTKLIGDVLMDRMRNLGKRV